jgi:DNA repair exonuclease SbcCD nuclease subunit
MSRTLRFMQISDLHLDSSLSGGRLGLPPEKRQRVNHDMARALIRAVEMARDAEVDVILMPGDAWDDESVNLQTAAQFFEVLGRAAPIPVIITPGNHDPYYVFSYYNPAFYLDQVGRPLPDNVHVFRTPEISRMALPELPGVYFYGCCFTENRPRSSRILAGTRAGAEDGLHVLLLHGSQDDGVAPNPEAFATAPFAAAELLDCGFDYTALGHYHRYSDIRGPAGNIRAAYGGIPVARGLDEMGDHFVLFGEIEKGGIRPDGLVQEYVDVRHIKRLTVQVDRTVMTPLEQETRITAALREAGTTADDIIYVMLQGYTHPDVGTFTIDPDWCNRQCFHLVVDQSQLSPDYGELDEESASDKHVEGRFNQRMLQLLADAGDDARRERLVRMARTIGRDALRGREVKPRNVY